MSFANELKKLDKSARNVKILTIDIETRPMVVYSWGLFKQFHHTDQIIDHGGLLCFSAKWLGEKQPMFFRGENMVQQAWDLLTEADVIVTYNGWRFDIPRLNNEFLINGMGPTAPFKHVDLFKTNKQRFDLPSRKLDYISGRVLGDHKTPHTGFGLWQGCMAGDEKSWRLMEKYNRQDVNLTEQLYLELLPWLVDQPHVGVMSQDENQRRCPYCGSAKLSLSQKPRYAYVRMYELYNCDACHGWVHSTALIGANHFTRAAK